LLSVILGVIEGLTEFIPVSSTAHLRIAEALLGIDLGSGYWKMYSIVIQLGAILCLPLYFRRRIAKFVSNFPRGERGDRTLWTHPLTLTLIAFVVTAVPAWLLTKIIGKHLENLYLMSLALIIGGIVMWIVDAIFGPPSADGNQTISEFRRIRTEHMEQMSLPQSVWIGACQILSAVFPGTSRSMSTIAAGQLVRMSREAALEFSFFLSMPTMIAATGYDLFRTVHAHPGEPNPIGAIHVSAQGWVILIIGFLISFFVAWGVVAWFMDWVRRRGFAPFAIYRILFGGVILGWVLHSGLR
jgi:undecaprenyl-diphosphatase